MIRLFARRDERPGTDGAFVYTIVAPGAEPFITGNPDVALEHLAALDVEDPGTLIEQVRQWREIEIR